MEPESSATRVTASSTTTSPSVVSVVSVSDVAVGSAVRGIPVDEPATQQSSKQWGFSNISRVFAFLEIFSHVFSVNSCRI
jgi:hypothetical protein